MRLNGRKNVSGLDAAIFIATAPTAQLPARILIISNVA
jgi:hypothetical protein